MVARSLISSLGLVLVLQAPALAFLTAEEVWESSKQERYRLYRHFASAELRNQIPTLAMRLKNGGIAVVALAAAGAWAAAAEVARLIYPLDEGTLFSQVPYTVIGSDGLVDLVLPPAVTITDQEAQEKFPCSNTSYSLMPQTQSDPYLGFYQAAINNYETTFCGGVKAVTASFGQWPSANISTELNVTIDLVIGSQYKVWRGYRGLFRNNSNFNTYWETVGTTIMEFTPKNAATTTYDPTDDDASHWVSPSGTNEVGYPQGTAAETSPGPTTPVSYYDPGSDSVVTVPYSDLPTVLPTFQPSPSPSPSTPTTPTPSSSASPSVVPSTEATPVNPSPASTPIAPPSDVSSWLAGAIGEPCEDSGTSGTLGYWVFEGKSYEGQSVARWVDLEWTRPIWAAAVVLSSVALVVVTLIAL